MPIFNFKSPYLSQLAFIHRSYLNEQAKINQSNERLEYLGDAVLELVISEYLYHRHPEMPEGKLTTLRSKIVQTSTLAWAANNLKLGKKLKMSKGEKKSGGMSNPSILADTFEALIGAIYLDTGYQETKDFIAKNLIKPFFDHLKELLPHDYKSHLQEEVQAQKLTAPAYKLISAKGPDHQKTFTVAVWVDHKQMAVGEGSSKQKAEQQAAKQALEKFTK